MQTPSRGYRYWLTTASGTPASGALEEAIPRFAAVLSSMRGANDIPYA
jgi:hypothetical protein